MSGFLISPANHLKETFLRLTVSEWAVICLFPNFKVFIQFFQKRSYIFILAGIQIKMQNRVALPIFFQPLDGQSGKEFFLPLEIGLQSRQQQALSETARAAQEIVTSAFCQLVDVGSLVYIKITVSPNLLEVLDADRVNLVAHDNGF